MIATSLSGNTPPAPPRPRCRRAAAWLLLAALPLLGACASSSITRSGALSSYEGLAQTKSSRARALYRADAATLAAARTVRLEPVRIADDVGTEASPDQRELITNAVGRILCARLNDRFEIVPPDAPADLSVQVMVTRLTPTDAAASAASIAVGIASPIPFTPRLPIGLGSFSAEGEAVDPGGRQGAALIWTRGADIFTTNARVSRIGDAYQLSGAFAKDMAKLMLTASDPFRRSSKAQVDSPDRPLSPVCAAYGKGPGAMGFIGGIIGTPPDWTDKGPAEEGPDE